MKYYKNFIKPYIVWSAIVIIIPLLMIFVYAFTKTGNSTIIVELTFDHFKRLFEKVYLDVFFKSIKLGLITVFFCLIFGYTLAYIIAQFKEKTQSILILFVTIPMWINMLLRTYAWISILADNGLFNMLLQKLGLNPVSLMYTDFSVLIGLICNFLPFMIIPIHTSLTKMDKSYIEASYDLGANKFQTFCKVILKLSMPGVINGVIMVFLLSVSSFVIPKLLGGGQYVLIGNLIESQFISVGDWNFGSAISMLLAIVILFAVRMTQKIDADNK